eukprot:NODE_1999_length_1013_cov_100.089212_g1625_i0.p1 GENE.NODE_1999_length_1013_cov_100.089212_g1625_i0~~NODE_1999_length_1013_cov_100.089212_g1625_i0.p1  ORF type:complete len:299 (-),score=101.62 NODE_1999_length_1013_cov_100.089212_g1625_i0:81-977(-)
MTVVHPQYPHEYNALSFAQLQELLADVRQNPVRKPAMVYHCGRRILDNYSSKLGNEIWTIYEQVLIAALDCNLLDDAKYFLQQLIERFSMESCRVRRLDALVLEAEHEYGQAMEQYNALLKQSNNCDVFAHKRRVAVARAQGHRAEAMGFLEEFLALYQCDEGGWHELASMHLADCNYKKASFCLEELLLHDPQNYLYALKYAETLYSVGEKRQMIEARKYFSHSVTLNCTSGNLRALYGLWMACLALANSHGMADNAENVLVCNWVVGKIKAVYAARPEARASTMLLMLKNNRVGGV